MKKNIELRSSDYSASSEICTIEIEFSDIDKENIKKSIEILKENEFIPHLRIGINGSITYFNDEDVKYYSDDKDENVGCWRFDLEQFLVFTSGVYYYAQSKWDNSDYIESEEININEILN
jgi:hypothetical protein